MCANAKIEGRKAGPGAQAFASSVVLISRFLHLLLWLVSTENRTCSALPFRATRLRTYSVGKGIHISCQLESCCSAYSAFSVNLSIVTCGFHGLCVELVDALRSFIVTLASEQSYIEYPLYPALWGHCHFLNLSHCFLELKSPLDRKLCSLPCTHKAWGSLCCHWRVPHSRCAFKRGITRYPQGKCWFQQSLRPSELTWFKKILISFWFRRPLSLQR